MSCAFDMLKLKAFSAKSFCVLWCLAKLPKADLNQNSTTNQSIWDSWKLMLIKMVFGFIKINHKNEVAPKVAPMAKNGALSP